VAAAAGGTFLFCLLVLLLFGYKRRQQHKEAGKNVRVSQLPQHNGVIEANVGGWKRPSAAMGGVGSWLRQGSAQRPRSAMKTNKAHLSASFQMRAQEEKSVAEHFRKKMPHTGTSGSKTKLFHWKSTRSSNESFLRDSCSSPRICAPSSSEGLTNGHCHVNGEQRKCSMPQRMPSGLHSSFL
jgi:hypothetical protein